MRTNIVIDEAVVAEVMKRSGLSTMRAAVDFSMRRYLEIERQKEAVEQLRGIGWEGDIDEMRKGDAPIDWE